VTIWDRVYEALAPLGVEVISDFIEEPTGSTGLPDLFVRFFMIDSVPQQHADGIETLREYHVQVSTFRRGGLYDLPDIVGAMTVAGFTHGDDTQIPFDKTTRHYGLAQEFWFLEDMIDG
jgi:hypothetical protein